MDAARRYTSIRVATYKTGVGWSIIPTPWNDAHVRMTVEDAYKALKKGYRQRLGVKLMTGNVKKSKRLHPPWERQYRRFSTLSEVMLSILKVFGFTVAEFDWGISALWAVTYWRVGKIIGRITFIRPVMGIGPRGESRDPHVRR